MTQPNQTPKPNRVYHIAAWEDSHENHDSRKYKTLTWYAKPNKHDGLGFRKLLLSRDRVELYCAWTLIMDVASKGSESTRGFLWRGDKPLDAEDLAIITGFPKRIFEKALEFFQAIGWLIPEEAPPVRKSPVKKPGKSEDPPAAPGDSPGVSGSPPAAPGDSPAVAQLHNQTKHNQTKVQEEGGAGSSSSSSKSPVPGGKPKSVIQFAALQGLLKDHPGQHPNAEAEERRDYREKKRQLKALQAKQAAGDI